MRRRTAMTRGSSSGTTLGSEISVRLSAVRRRRPSGSVPRSGPAGAVVGDQRELVADVRDSLAERRAARVAVQQLRAVEAQRPVARQHADRVVRDPRDPGADQRRGSAAAEGEGATDGDGATDGGGDDDETAPVLLSRERADALRPQ